MTTFYIDKGRKKTPQKIIFKIQDRGWQNCSGKRLEATRSWKGAFKVHKVLAATAGLVTSYGHISLGSQPVTCSHDPLLVATTRYLRPRPVTCGHDLLLAVRTHYLRPRSITCGHDPLLAVRTRYFQIWNKAVSKVNHVPHC